MAPVTEPFPISHVAGRYLLFDVDTVMHARREHNICGVLSGTIPNLSQQNVFLGIPLQLTAEEARVLVEQGHAYIVDEVEGHQKGFMEMRREDRLKFLQELDRQGAELALGAKKAAEDRADKALKQKGLARVAQEKSLRAESEAAESTASDSTFDTKYSSASGDDNALFDSTPLSPNVVAVPEKKLEPQFITPTTSYPPLPLPPTATALPVPVVPKSYPLFKYLHSRGYFSMPGLRFGCHYSVYPGDPLRFHSHFLATGVDWDEEFDLLDVIGGGRLGTGVKKAYLLGGEDPASTASTIESEGIAKPESVRAFSIEWAGL